MVVDAGGKAVTFGSDAHDPATLGNGITEPAQLARSFGFDAAVGACLPWHR